MQSFNTTKHLSAMAENQPLATSELTISKVLEAVFCKRLFSDDLNNLPNQMC